MNVDNDRLATRRLFDNACLTYIQHKVTTECVYIHNICNLIFSLDFSIFVLFLFYERSGELIDLFLLIEFLMLLPFYILVQIFGFTAHLMHDTLSLEVTFLSNIIV